MIPSNREVAKVTIEQGSSKLTFNMEDVKLSLNSGHYRGERYEGFYLSLPQVRIEGHVREDGVLVVDEFLEHRMNQCV